MLNFFGLFSVDTLYVILGMAAFTLISFIIAIVAIAKASGMKKKYKEFMADGDGKSIESLIKENLEDISSLKQISKDNTIAVKDIYEKMQSTFQKVGLIKYDAFHEMGGRLSFALCMLDKNNTGYLVNVMHSNTGCFAYAKEVVNGKTFTEIGDEEQKALKQAIAGHFGDEELSAEVNSMMQKDKM